MHPTLSSGHFPWLDFSNLRIIHYFVMSEVPLTWIIKKIAFIKIPQIATVIETIVQPAHDKK